MHLQRRVCKIAMNEKIRHEGVIESVTDRKVIVRIFQTAACSSCQIANHCSASEAKEKLIEVCADNETPLNIGQHVVVSTSSKVAFLSVWLGFGLPLLLMLGVLFFSLWIGADESTAALAAIGILIPYYIIIWCSRKQISRRVSFTIETSTH